MHTPLEQLQQRVDELESRLARGRRRGWLLAGAAVLVAVVAAGRPSPEEVLRVRGLVVEDAAGRPRLLLGAPAPAVQERRRDDDVIGLVLLGEDGADRLQLGHVGGPQMGGRVQERVSPATGLMCNEPGGDERAGFGVFENGQAGWGLDWPGGEGIVAAVLPDRGMAGIFLAGPEGETRERAQLITTGEGETVMQLNDATGTGRAILRLSGTGAPTLEVHDAEGNVLRDVLATDAR